MRIVKPSVALLWITPNAEQEIERAGRTCYKSEDRITDQSAARFVRRVVERGHDSVIEHGVASMRIVCDRGITHEIVRHRLASYSQESTRYCNYNTKKHGYELTFIEPPGFTSENRMDWRQACRMAEEVYSRLVGNGCAPEIARSVLPNCLKTEIVVTANFREWRHIIRLRTSPAAHPQIREVIDMARDILVAECPTVFDDLKV